MHAIDPGPAVSMQSIFKQYHYSNIAICKSNLIKIVKSLVWYFPLCIIQANAAIMHIALPSINFNFNNSSSKLWKSSILKQLY